MNLLDDPVFTVETPSGRESCSLPRVYALLMNDEVDAFTRLQAHQKQAWHCFLAQLGAIATEDRDLPDAEAGWRDALSALTVPEAWNLYTEELGKPAFMQPPVPEGSTDPFLDSKGDLQRIDITEYDIPVLSKSHAMKTRRIREPKSEHWVYMITNVQTAESGWGRGKYPTSRMNGGYGTRAFFSTTRSLRMGPWIKHDIQRLNTYKKDVAERYEYSESKHPLLWVLPWDGSKEDLSMKDLHPWYIDCCRRIRNTGTDWVHTGTKGTRVGGVVNGQTGDPWIPVNGPENKILMPNRWTFRYDKLWKVLFKRDQYDLPPGFADVRDGYIILRTLTPNDTEREYNLERVIPFTTNESEDPFHERKEIGPESKETGSVIAREAEDRVKKASEGAEIFSHALAWIFCEDADEGTSSGIPDALVPARNRQINALHGRIDERFFDRLFDAPDMSDDERQTFWETILVDVMRTQMREALTLCPNKQSWKRKAHAQSVFTGRMRSDFTYAEQLQSTDDSESRPDLYDSKSNHAAV